LKSNHNIPLLITLLLALPPITAAQKPKPVVNSTPVSDSSGTIPIFMKSNSPPDTQKQRKDTCLLPPLDQVRTSVVAAAQLRIPGKAWREYQRACSDVAKKKSSNAEQHLRKAVQEYPKYTAAWVTLGQVLANEHSSENAMKACSQATTVDATYLPAYLCLAEIASRTQDWREEQKYSNRALELDANSVLAYEYQAAANANLGNLDDAERSGLRALDLGKDRHDPGVYFLMAQIYKLKGDVTRAEEQLRLYLKYTHNRDRAAMAKTILAKLESGPRDVLYIPESKASPHTSGQAEQRWVPADIDEGVSSVVEDATCPLSLILQGASQRVIELAENLQRFTATERIEHTEFSKNGKSRNSTRETFSYVASIEPNTDTIFEVNEYRIARQQTERPPLEDTGTAAFALMFHPKLIGNLETRCEGRTDFQGTPAWQLRFAEVPDPSKAYSVLRTKDSEYRLRLKGRVWISADNYQVLRLQTDLAAPISEINLHVLHFDVSYAPVESSKYNFRLWLPESASIYVEYHGRRYQRVHSFSHFQLFLVETEQRIKEPVPPISKSELTSNGDPIP
jgi:tetratricopeptide (TPR) repeat protein